MPWIPKNFYLRIYAKGKAAAHAESNLDGIVHIVTTSVSQRSENFVVVVVVVAAKPLVLSNGININK